MGDESSNKTEDTTSKIFGLHPKKFAMLAVVLLVFVLIFYMYFKKSPKEDTESMSVKKLKETGKSDDIDKVTDQILDEIASKQMLIKGRA